MSSFYLGDNQENDKFGDTPMESVADAQNAAVEANNSKIGAEANAEVVSANEVNSSDSITQLNVAKLETETNKNILVANLQTIKDLKLLIQVNVNELLSNDINMQTELNITTEIERQTLLATEYVTNMNVVALTLLPEEEPTASYDLPSKTLTLGIPKGKTASAPSGDRPGMVMVNSALFIGNIERWANLDDDLYLTVEEAPILATLYPLAVNIDYIFNEEIITKTGMIKIESEKPQGIDKKCFIKVE